MTTKISVTLAALPLVLLAGCENASTAPDAPAKPTASDTTAEVASPNPDTAPTATPTAPAPPTGDPAVNDGYPDLTPAPLAPAAERTEKGARNVIVAFARAIELSEWDQAWSMLSPGDQVKWPKARWAAQFADLKDIMVAVPTGTMEGAAGSSYYTAPVTITASDREGRPVRYEGEAVLRRVNDVDGATPAQLRWHFERLTLDWTH